MDRVTNDLIEKTRDISGANIEHNMFCVSAHYRGVSDADRPRFQEIVDEIVASDECLIKHDGKMVWEVRPRVAWDKGKALSYLRDALIPDLAKKGFGSEEVFTVYVGDDVTDEDAFMEINEKLGDHLGVGVLVSHAPKVSAAKFSLRNTPEVLQFLTTLSELADAGLNVDSWGGAMGIPKRTFIGAAAATPAAATAPAADAADAAPAPA